MPLAFEDFQGKGALDFSPPSSDSLLLQQHHLKQKQKEEQNWLLNHWYRGITTEPTSVLDNCRTSPSTPTSSSTLSSSVGRGNNGGGGRSSTTGVAAASTISVRNPPSVEISTTEKCGGGLGMEDWETVLSGSPNQEQSILRLIMGDFDDPSLGLNKILPLDMEFNAGFGVVDQASFAFETPFTSTNTFVTGNIDPDFGSNARLVSVPDQSHIFSTAAGNLFPPSGFQQHTVDALDEKPQMLNSRLLMNQDQAYFTQHTALFLPHSYDQMQEHQLLSPAPQPQKRLNVGSKRKVPFADSGQQEPFLRRQQQQAHLQMLQQKDTRGVTATSVKQKLADDELATQQLQQAIIDEILKASELIETGNPVLAQGILARLNHQLSPIGKPFHRAAFYFKEALQLLLQTNNSSSTLSDCSIIFKISAYKSFSEISPVLQFANFTCNQALLEALEGCSRIHIVDFDIGFGGQWASLMQELVLRSSGPPSLKITAVASPTTHDELELSFTQENLKHFACEINMPFKLEIIMLEALNSASLPLSFPENEVTAVNLPIGTFSNHPTTFTSVLHLVKLLKPKIIVSSDRACDRMDVPFHHHMIYALQSYSALLESMDAVNVNLEELQKVERFLIYPCVEKLVLNRQRSHEQLPPWKSLFLQCGFVPLVFSNCTESQADCLVQRTPVKGFHVEKKRSALVLCWLQKELISATAWRC